MSNPEKTIDKTISIEELIHRVPPSVKFLSEKGIRCIVCGEPIWGTLEEAALEKGLTQEEIAAVVDELNKMAKS